MLIRALCDYYDVLAAEDKIVEKGFAKLFVHYAIMLSPDGKIKGITDISNNNPFIDDKGKAKKIQNPIQLKFPFREDTSSIMPYRIDHRSKYIFGLLFNSKNKTLEIIKNNAHSKFVERNLEFIKELDEPIVNAFRNFLLTFKPENEIENPIILKLGKELNSSNFCFVLDGFKGIYLNEANSIIQKIRDENNISECDNDLQNRFICSITGEKDVIARKHLKIKGLNGNMSSGYKLVSVNENSGESYGKTDGFISSISEKSMFKYTEAFNYITSNVDSNTQKYTNMAYIDSMTIIFFAVDKKADNEDAIMRFFTSGISNNSSVLEPQLTTVMNHIQNGNAISINEIMTDSSADYYVVGLVTNSSRICMKFCYRDTFGNIFNNVLQHQRDISIVGMGDKPITIYQLANELVRPVPKGNKEKREEVPPPLLSALMESVIMGRRYPDSLFNTVINRVKIDKDSKDKDSDDKKTKVKKTKDDDTKDNDTKNVKSVKVNARRAGLIKAYLNRNYKEDFTMALDENRKDTAYLCGRLFAVLEFIQAKAQGNELNTTIKDSYFATACTTPAVVFPQMILLAQNHLKKMETEQARKFDNRIAWLINDIESFPATFSTKEQGVFILGYYQQRCFRYEKKQDTDENNQ